MVPGSRNPMWGEEFNFSVDELPVEWVKMMHKDLLENMAERLRDRFPWQHYHDGSIAYRFDDLLNIVEDSFTASGQDSSFVREMARLRSSSKGDEIEAVASGSSAQMVHVLLTSLQKECYIAHRSATLSNRMNFPYQINISRKFPAILSNSESEPYFELFFPISGFTYRINHDLYRCRIIGQSLFVSERTSWIVLCRYSQPRIHLYNGYSTIALSSFPYGLQGFVFASFIEEPRAGSGCFLLLVEVAPTIQRVKCWLYNPVRREWTNIRVFRDRIVYNHMAAGAATTMTHFFWFDIITGSMFSLENYWLSEVAPDLDVYELQLRDEEDVNPIQGARSVSSIIRDGRLYDGRLYCVAVMTMDRLSPLSLLRHESICCNFMSCGIYLYQPTREGEDVYLNSVVAECVRLEINRPNQPAEILKPCHRLNPITELCSCKTAVLMLDEASLINHRV